MSDASGPSGKAPSPISASGRRRLWAVVVLLALPFAAVYGAPFYEKWRFDADYRACLGSDLAEVQRDACTRVIKSGQCAGEALSAMYSSRGKAQSRLQRSAEAASDYEAALSINPRNADALANKAKAEFDRNRVPRAP